MRFTDLLKNNDDIINEGDRFELELDFLIIESNIIGFMSDGVVIEVDDIAMAYLLTEDVKSVQQKYTQLQLAIMEGGNSLDEAEYHGRTVTLNKKMQGDVKKSKVYVKDPKTGNIKKVNFGDKTMRIKKSNPARRKSYRARHNCANPGPKTKANYWSCRSW
jgi:hypothetical protein